MAYILPMMTMNDTDMGMMEMAGMDPERTRVRCGNLAVDYPLKGWYSTGWLVVAIFCFSICPVTAAFNLSILVTICSRRRLRTISNLLLGCLAFPDFLVGFFSQPMYGVVLLQARSGSVSCGLFTITVLLAYILGSASFFTLFFISLERYVAVFYPYWYDGQMHKKRTLCVVISVLWFLCILINCCSLMTQEFLLTVITASVMFPFILSFSCFVHFRIIRLVRQIHREILSQERSARVRNVGHNEAVSRATRVAAFILLGLLVCYGPYTVVIVWGYSSMTRSDELFVAHGFAQVLLLMNSFVNPLLYCFQLRELRNEMRLLPCCCSNKWSISNTASQTRVITLAWRRSDTPSS